MINKIYESIYTFVYCIKISLKSSYKYTFFRLICKIIMAVLPLAISYFFRNIINLMVEIEHVDSKEIIVSVVLYCFTIIANLSIVNLNLYIMNMHSHLIQNYMKVEIANKVMELDISVFDDSQTYDKITNAEMNIQSTISMIWGMTDVVGSIVSCVIAFWVLASFSICGGVIMFVVSVPNAVFSQLYTKKIYQWEKANVAKQRENQYFYSLMTSRNTCMDIRFWNIGHLFMKKYLSSWNKWYLEKKVLLKKRNFAQIFTNCLPFLAMGGILSYIAIGVKDNKMNIGDFSLFLSQLEQLNSSIISLILALISIYDNKLRVKNIIVLKRENSKIRDGYIELNDSFESIEFRNVSFTYPFVNNKVLDNVNLKINVGEKIAVVGLNGAGKTTILKLLLRFYDVDTGEILVNGKNIKAYTIKSLRNKFSVFFQQSTNYAFTVEENVRISDINADNMNDLFKKSLIKSGFYDVMKQFAKGKDSNVTKIFDKAGIQLSAGQDQKLALARTFYRDKEVLLLDEPSSSLDPKAEYEMFNIIANESKMKTVVFISHRLSNIDIADKIIVLNNGKVIEEGTHKELMEKKGEYYNLYFYQASKFFNGNGGK